MKRVASLPIRRTGILRFSTWMILAGGAVGLTGCDSSERKAREARLSYETESKRLIDELDSQRRQLLSGEVPNNFHIPGIGYYHAAAHDFYETAYNAQKDGKWFVNNAWVDQAGPAEVPASRPSPEVLGRIDARLAQEERQLDATAAQAQNYQHQASSGPGLGTALMMYWLLSGNRGGYTGGSGFSSFGRRAPLFETTYRQQREDQARTRTGYAAGGSSGSSSYGSRSSGSTAGAPDSNNPSRSSGSSFSGGSSGPSSRGGFGSSGGGSSS